MKKMMNWTKNNPKQPNFRYKLKNQHIKTAKRKSKKTKGMRRS